MPESAIVAAAAAAAPAALIDQPVYVLAVLLGVLAVLFGLKQTAVGKRVYGVVPILLFCYFVPTVISNTGLIPSHSKFELYVFIKDWLLPASLLLLVLAVDIPAILGLGSKVLILFAAAVVSVIIGGPLAYFALSWMFEPGQHDEVWRGLAALSGSWIGGGANMTAIKESVEASDNIFSAIVVVDVFVAEIWTAVLFFFAGRELIMDQKVGADRASLDVIREKAEAYQAQVQRPTDLGSLVIMLALAFGASALAHEGGIWLDGVLPKNDVTNAFAWKIILITLFGLALSFTRLRRLEGVGASHVGSVFLYLLIASIGAKAHFASVVQPENLPLVAVGALWMIFHVTVIMLVRRWLKAPIFFAAIGSRACIGGAASTPIVAAAFNPALVPVGVLLAILGYIFGTLGGVACAFLLEFVRGVVA